MPGISSPVRALMRENMRRIKMKAVNHIRIAQWFEKNQLIVIGPARPARDHRVPRSAFANGRSQFRLHSIPAVSIGKLRLVQNFTETSLRIPRKIMPSHRPPEVAELLHETVVLRQPRLKIAGRMQIDHYRQP